MHIKRAIRCHSFIAAAFFLLAGGGCTVEQLVRDGVLVLPRLGEATCARPPNGCGPAGILGAVVPECPLPDACFIPACDAHDLCYRDCGITKTRCDNDFLMNMQFVCSETFNADDPQLALCDSFAFVYAAAVGLFGNEIFVFTQLLGCACDPPSTRAAKSVETFDLLAAGPPYEDADGDLAPDDWERSVGLDPTDPSDAMRDDDGDGFVNLVEFLHQADPFDPASPQ